MTVVSGTNPRKRRFGCRRASGERKVLTIQDVELGSARSQLQLVAEDVGPDEERQFRNRLPAAALEARRRACHWDYFAPARAIDALLDDRNAFPEGGAPKGKARLRRVAVARLTLECFQVREVLPRSVLALYPEFLRRLAKFVAEGAKERYDEELFAKDVRYALGLSVPCGALQFDVVASIGPKLILREAVTKKSLGPFAAYLKCGGWGRWYSEHIDPRAIREFNPDGWTAHCAKMAEVLQLNPEVRGILGAGWFYDPAVAENSPGLAYIQRTQMRYGGFLLRVGTEQHHIENALFRSAARRRLYEEGKYLPTCYLLAWPRRALIAWAEQLKIDPSVQFSAFDPTAKRALDAPNARTLSASDASPALN
jgi:hypothetical protein